MIDKQPFVDQVTALLVSSKLLPENAVLTHNISFLQQYCVNKGVKIGLIEPDYEATVNGVTMRCYTEEYMRDFMTFTVNGESISVFERSKD